jgi:hypothetical protein
VNAERAAILGVYIVVSLIGVACGIAGALHGDWVTPIFWAAIIPLSFPMVRDFWRAAE